MDIKFKQVDVFTDRRYGGNPVAVILDGTGLDTEQMQQIANWTNLSETTFVLPATTHDADYRVRIFTQRNELPFAGHPTLGTAHALLESGLVKAKNGELVQECGAGLVRLRVKQIEQGQHIAFELPQPKVTVLSDDQTDALESLLGGNILRDPPARLIDVGPKWIVAQLPDAASVLALRPDLQRMTELDQHVGSTGVTVFGKHPIGHAVALEVRTFAPSVGVSEDPVCGSGNGAVAVYVRESGQVETLGSNFQSGQGTCVGRQGRIQVEFGSNGEIRIGGQSITCIDGVLIKP
ncbi:phenazine biosynthesis protein PhzF [Pandoraea terrae]|uniref:Phenazine biosynthesis protein PhzF n=1 Tax=Pandoraea terrae TaxID=1537710 RepID=A0A5E4ZAV7_9BURK|nr:PhzF family phenazine biosynthesis protein [Pandoraea terrae]VVE57742.1 phenazine biosynthesis protein PhzF [Pandoraea terrae]